MVLLVSTITIVSITKRKLIKELLYLSWNDPREGLFVCFIFIAITLLSILLGILIDPAVDKNVFFHGFRIFLVGLPIFVLVVIGIILLLFITIRSLKLIRVVGGKLGKLTNCFNRRIILQGEEVV